MSQPFRLNLFRPAAQVPDPVALREDQWRSYLPEEPVEKVLSGQPWKLRPGLTFTPYANPTACNAHCAFCSEELLRKDAERLTAHTLIGEHGRYFEGLARAWEELAGFPMGLSLSGLEATSDPPWMLRLLELVRAHDALFPHRVLYTNGSGLCTHPALLDALAHARFDRVELSRCHPDEQKNQRVMRFERDQPVWRAAAFEDTARRLRARTPVKLVCILNALCVRTPEDVEQYVRWGLGLGVDRFVFRELSALGDAYHDGREARWLEEHRVSARGLLDALHPTADSLREGWRFAGATSGYYYSNEVLRFEGAEVTVESASYVAHAEVLGRGVLQKLVFHSNGDLCGDWVPNALRIGNYFR